MTKAPLDLVQRGQEMQRQLALEALNGKRQPTTDLGRYLVKKILDAQTGIERASLALGKAREQVQRLEKEEAGHQALQAALLTDLGQVLMTETAEEAPPGKDKQ